MELMATDHTESKLTLRELQVYKLKVDLFVHRYGESSGLFGTGRRCLAGSDVWLDQITPDGWAVFGIFNPEGGGVLQGFYVKCPIDIANEQVEESLGDDGKPVMLEKRKP